MWFPSKLLSSFECPYRLAYNARHWIKFVLDQTWPYDPIGTRGLVGGLDIHGVTAFSFSGCGFKKVLSGKPLFSLSPRSRPLIKSLVCPVDPGFPLSACCLQLAGIIETQLTLQLVMIIDQRLWSPQIFKSIVLICRKDGRSWSWRIIWAFPQPGLYSWLCTLGF